MSPHSMFVNEVCKVGLDMKDVVCDRNLIENMVNDFMGHGKEEFLNSAREVAMLANHCVSDVDQLNRIVSVLGNINEETWPSCSKLPDYGSISFGNVENPSGLEACMPNCSPNEVSLVQRLVCYDPAKRTTTMELLQDKYFSEEPLPVPISELQVPLTRNGQD
ncbi:hypothetical protein JHK82_047827 [Glycine max]|nr:hypothetical protein JHK82_047827 [Glycine max]